MPEIKPFDGAAVLQAAPESPPERRRGRPRVTPAMWDVSVERLEGPNKSRRTIIKRFDTGAALRALDTEDQDFGYIIGPDKPRWEILAEWGRLGDKDAIREAAAEICKREMKTKEALARLRRSRIGKSKPGASWRWRVRSRGRLTIT